MKYSFFLGVSFFIAICFFAVKMPTAQAAFYNASGVLGQTDSNGNMVYTTNGINNNKGASSITPQGLYLPLGAAADPINHRLFVEDFTNGRILVFKLDANDNIATTSASYVLGQVNLTSTSTGVSTSTLSLNVPTLVGPEGISYDSANQRLFVMDSGNSRVMVFDVATSTISNGEAAIAEIGQANFTSNTQLCLQNRLGYQPTELEYDATNSRLFVDDFGNSRILVFDASTTTLASTPMGENASAVIGQTTYTSCNAAATQSRLNLPMGVSYDGGTGRLFVTDKNNHRVLVFDASPATLAATSTGDIAMDVIGQTNYTNNGHSTTQTGLNFPSGGVYDPISKRLFVTDNSNSRIMIFDGSTTTLASTPIGENAIDVMGQANYTSTLTLNNYQGGTLVGPSIFNTPFFSGYDSTYQHLFVPDWNNNRLLEFNFGGGAYFGTDNFSLSNAATPSANSATQNLVLNNSSLAQSSGNWSISSSASWLTFTANSGSLAIGASTTIGFIENFSTLPYGYSYATATITSAQAANSPINITVTISRSYPASAGLGQLDGSGNMVYTSNSSNNGQGSPNAQGFSFPLGATVDSISHRLFVSDYFNNRVLVYPLDSANNISTTTASYVLGQSSFSVNNGAVSTSTLSGPWGCAYDSANQRLFVTDSGFNRVMVYSVPTSTNLTGKNASAVIGQTTFSGSGSNHTQSTLNNPRGLDYDPVTGRLFVVDFGNHRVLVFDASTSTLAATSTGDIAQAVIGQTNYTNNGSSSLQNRLNFPSLDVYDSATGRLFVDDKINNRILVFDGSTTTLASTPTGENAMDVIGQTSFTNNSTGSTASTLNIPTGVNYDSVTGRLIVDDSSNNRILFFDASTTTLASTPTGESAEGVIGQADFISNSTAVSQSALLNPTGTGWDSTGRHLFEPDWSNNRVLQFNLVNITNSSLANGGIGASYSQTITSTSSQGTVSYSLAAGSFPSGISLNTSTGVISGTPTAVGSYPVSIKGTDTITSGSFQTQSSFTLSVASTTPQVPLSIVATPLDIQASVAFSVPSSNGGSAITAYTVTSSPGNKTATGSSSPIVVNGLVDGTSYTFTVTATNALGTSASSSPSNSVTPTAPASSGGGDSGSGGGGGGGASNPPPVTPTTPVVNPGNPSSPTSPNINPPQISTNGTAPSQATFTTSASGSASGSNSVARLINDQGTFYIVQNNQLLGITNPGILNSYGLSFKDASVPTTQDMSLPKSSSNLSPDNGSLVKTKDDPTVYLISNGQKYGFASAKVFTSLGFKFSSVLTVTSPELNNLSLAPTVINTTNQGHNPGVDINVNGTIYWVGPDNLRHPYPSLAVYNSWHIDNDFSAVVKANSADLTLPLGSEVGERVMGK